MSDYPLDDELLLALRSARPVHALGVDEIDDAKSLELLEKILSGETREKPSALQGSRWRRGLPGRRPGLSRVPFVLTIAAFVVAAVVVPLATLSNRTPYPSSYGQSEAAWRFVGDITQPSWEVGSSTGSALDVVSCPTSVTCYASGTAATPPNETSGTTPPPVVEVTHDGGASWEASPIVGANDYLGPITCPGPTTCMVLGDERYSATSTQEMMFTTRDGGQTWSSQPLPGRGDLDAFLSCATTTHCVTLENEPGPGGQGIEYVSLVTNDGGATWSSSSLPGTFRAYALQCVTATFCVAAGQAPSGYTISNPKLHVPAAMVYSTDGGIEWAEAQVPDDGDIVGALSCADASHCMAIENTVGPKPNTQVISSVNGGQSWLALSSGGVSSAILTHISCASATDCWLTGTTNSTGNGSVTHKGVIFSTTNEGHTFTSEQVPTYQGSALQYVGPIACPAVSSCFAFAPPPSSSSSPFSQQLVLTSGISQPS